MKLTLAAMLLVGTILSPAVVRAAVPAKSTGGPADLIKAVDARAAKLGPISSAEAPLAQLASFKGLVGVTFNDLLPVKRGAGQTAFIGHHLAAGVSDFAWVTFPADVSISTNSSAVVVGSFSDWREITTANGTKLTVPVLAAQVLGIIDGATFSAGVPTFSPNSPIRIYEKSARKTAAKKETAPKP